MFQDREKEERFVWRRKKFYRTEPVQKKEDESDEKGAKIESLSERWKES